MTTPAPKYPGLPVVGDGSEAIVYVESNISQGACAYPITPSTNMGVGYQMEVANGKKNLWGEPLQFVEPESEHSSASAAEGYALAGGRVTNFTSGQGLILMKEVLYVIAGKQLPVVFHIAARALTSQSLNIHGGHDDVMGVADVGWGILFARNAQEAADLALIARRAAEETGTPFMNVQDGFLTTHTVDSYRYPEPELMKEFVGEPSKRLTALFDPAHPIVSGSVQNQDSYMRGKIAQRRHLGETLTAVRRAMEEYTALTGRRYAPVDAYRMEDAEVAVVVLGTMAETAAATADALRPKGLRLGVVHPTLFRPFPGGDLARSLEGVRSVAVVERMDAPLGQSNPLTVEVKASLADAATGAAGYPKIEHLPVVLSGTAGLGGRDVTAGDFAAVAKRLRDFARVARPEGRIFTLGIDHPLALAREEDLDVRPRGSFSMRGYSVGGYGSVTTNRVIAALVGDLFGLEVQAFPKYGSEKKGLPTNYFLTVASERIRIHQELRRVEFVALNDTNAFRTADPLAGLAEGGTVFVQTEATTPESLWESIPEGAQAAIRERGLHLWGLDTVKVGRETASRPELVQRMQGVVLLGIFLKAAPFVRERGIPEADLWKGVEKSLRRYFGKRGEAVVADNLKAVQRGFRESFEVPEKLAALRPRAAAGGAR